MCHKKDINKNETLNLTPIGLKLGQKSRFLNFRIQSQVISYWYVDFAIVTTPFQQKYFDTNIIHFHQ